MVSLGSLKAAAELTPKSLYKLLLRKCELLPNADIQNHYKHSIRQSFGQHSDENDPERVKQIINQAMKDSDWVLKKYNIKEERANPQSKKGLKGKSETVKIK